MKVPENKMLKLNTALRGHDAGSTVRVKVDNGGIPLDPYWRRRLNDSKVDECVEFVDNKKKAKKVSAED